LADNVAISAGSGTSIATDDVGGVHYQKFKLILGAENAADGPVDMGQQAMAASLPVVIASDQSAVAVKETRAATATLANVSGSASSVTLQALNANRLAVEVFNDSTATLYVKYGASASTTSFTRKLFAGEAFREELYTGIITGIWESATGAARMTELTA
jgi:hypothetical protein